MSRVRWCYIVGCRNPATLIVESYPDDILLCDDHAWLRYDDELDDWPKVAAVSDPEAPQ